MSRLVVCADDYALNPGVSRAIRELADQGRISATSAMVWSDHWPEHAKPLRDLAGRISVGLHLDGTSPWALRAGHGMPLGLLMLRSALGALDVARLREAIERQLDRFEAAWQAPPDHVDGHQHIQQFPVLRQALVQVLQQRYGHSRRPWLRVSRPHAQERGFKSWLIGRMGASPLAALAQQAGLPHSTTLVGISDFTGDAQHWLDQAQTWLDWIRQSPDAVLMCHPGLADADAHDGIASARVQEWQALSDPRWPLALQSRGLSLTRQPGPCAAAEAA